MSLGWANTDIDGYYTATVTAPFSRIKIRFGEWGWPSFYAPEWYDDKDYFSSADAIILPAGGTIPNVNAALGKLGVINGTVTFDESGLPVEGASVSAHSSDGATNWYWHDTTDGTGHYEFSVPAGIYKLRFAGGPISEEWYQDEVSQSTAYSVTVVTGQTKIINASVAPAGQIAGTVTDEATGLPITAVITVYDLSDKVVGYTGTDNDGLYQVGGLDTGSYKVRFRKNDYCEEYYDNQPNRAQANLVSVTAGATTSNINAALTPLPSAITGTVTKDGGDPLEWDEDVYVSLYDAAWGDWVDDYFFMGDGITTEYTFRVSPGTYHVLFDSINPGFGIEWYSDKTSQANADLVTVAYGQTKTDVSADLTTATGCITGVLTAADDGSRIPDANVEVFYTEDWWWEDKTDSNGEYQICGLAGDFQVRFSHGAYQVEWYDNRSSQATADTVTVANGATTPDINAVLTLGGCISGRVVDENGLFRPEAWVVLLDSAGHLLNWHDFLDVDAGYVFCGLPTGNYYVECYDGELSGSTTASATVGQETSGVICQLSPTAYTYLPLILKNGR
jgi:5-hydroxyisourate hydrolase-like protein (transthyretin family)